ncbi:MAG: Bacterial Ig domain [Microbacterium sp.]|jgi:hypothetical protein|uniref:Ig-like domain-containing protein n=1 Tax=Microbacterium sp. TaxID=51671 RepID=UPI0026231A48|nr:Ig-like domain-containing protein [Microbacterium sp.]MDF2559101.1 Bacterial Ig domain [Microbacterium sp.]
MNKIGKMVVGAAVFVGLMATAAPASAATFDLENAPVTSGYGDRFVLPGSSTRVQMHLTSEDDIPAGSVNLAFTVNGDASFEAGVLREVSFSGSRDVVGVLQTPQKIQVDRFDGFFNAKADFRNLYAQVAVPAGAAPGTVYTVGTGVGISNTGNTNTADVTSQQVRLTVASTDPVDITAPATGSVVQGDSVHLSGTGAYGGSILTVKDEAGNVLGSPVVAADGSWTLGVSGLTDGDHTFTVTQKDLAGTVTTDSTQITFIDSSAGTPALDPAVAGGVLVAGAGIGGTLFTARRRRRNA